MKKNIYIKKNDSINIKTIDNIDNNIKLNIIIT